MAEFGDFDIEVQDEKDAKGEQLVGVVTTAGTPVTIAPSNGKPFQGVEVACQAKGPNSNPKNTWITVKTSSNTEVSTVVRGGWRFLPIVDDSIEIDSNTNGAKLEITFILSK